MIMMENKVIYKHRYVHGVRNKVDPLNNKVQHFKNKFIYLFSKGMPCFWDDKGNIISRENYQALLVEKKSEEDKF